MAHKYTNTVLIIILYCICVFFSRYNYARSKNVLDCTGNRIADQWLKQARMLTITLQGLLGTLPLQDKSIILIIKNFKISLIKLAINNRNISMSLSYRDYCLTVRICIPCFFSKFHRSVWCQHSNVLWYFAIKNRNCVKNVR